MPIALYGKLPAKRDFIAEGVPRGFLDAFEPWLQGGLAASRLALGAEWQRIYYEAPLWRFHLGPGHCGRALLGAIMPSVDGVGRCFPLVAFGAAPQGETFPSPQEEPQAAWFEALEVFLLSTLDMSDFSRVMAARDALEAPRSIPLPSMPDGVTALAGATVAVSGPEGVSPLELAAQADAYLGILFASLWWTTGGLSFPAAALCGRSLPDAESFSGLLTGHLFARPISRAGQDREAAG